ncbi:DUSP10 isoform 4 [Pongo abelii]|uniref:DUSP10 isoform 2 n=1 Tax=Pongo abelii TaxID=9601 RepID=A0A2J8U2G9_PONAB|nr:DUSP10 isoform 2 [Pongo abelii]PNJ39465.1 DUSP10 isoform 3 [Pongo abelii]PNJ39466.1 DUSP10 isoform 4 [Pongo abelii]
MKTSVTTPSSSKSAGRWGAAHPRPRACYLSPSPPPLTSRTLSSPPSCPSCSLATSRMLRTWTPCSG